MIAAFLDNSVRSQALLVNVWLALASITCQEGINGKLNLEHGD